MPGFCYWFSLGALSLGLGLMMNWPAAAGFAVEMSPARLEVNVHPGKTVRAAIKLRTRGRGVQQVVVTKGTFGLSDDGVPVFDAPQDKGQSAAAWITLSHTEFKINPNQDRQLRFEITVPPQTPAGGYRAAVFIAPPSGDGLTTKMGANIFLQGRLGLLIYVTVGDAKPDGVITAWDWQKLTGATAETLAFQVTNRGKAHLRLAGIALARDAQGNKYEGLVPGAPVLPGQTRWVALEFPEAGPVPGSSVDIEATVDLGQGERKIKARVGGRK